MGNDNKYVRLHEKWILQYVIENRALEKKIKDNDLEIQKLRNWNREILGRDVWMAKLYKLTQNYNNLLELVDNPDVPTEMLEESLNSIDDEIDTKAENIAKVIKSIESDIAGLKGEEKRLADRRKSLEGRIDNLKEYVEGSMRAVGKEKIRGKVFTLGIQKNAPSVDIIDKDVIPEQYFITKKELSKKDILVALKKGEEVPGAAVKQTESLRIR